MGTELLCFDAFNGDELYRVEALHHLVFDGTAVVDQFPKDLQATRQFV